jgi:hypothetical protein
MRTSHFASLVCQSAYGRGERCTRSAAVSAALRKRRRASGLGAEMRGDACLPVQAARTSLAWVVCCQTVSAQARRRSAGAGPG